MAKTFDLANQELKKEIIFNATFKVILMYGISGLTIHLVAKEAGVSKSLVHYYFKDKENLLIEFIQALFQKFINYIERRYDASDPPQIKLKAFFGAGKDFIEDQRDLFIVLMEIWSYCLRDSSLRKEYAELNRKTSGVMSNIIEEGIGAGVFNQVRKDTLSAFYLAFVVGAGILWQIDNKFLNLGDQFDLIIKRFTKILLKKIPK